MVYIITSLANAGSPHAGKIDVAATSHGLSVDSVVMSIVTGKQISVDPVRFSLPYPLPME